MTQVAEPTAGAVAGLERVSHWIAGQRVAGRSGRSGPVYDPARGVIARTVDFASIEAGRVELRPGPFAPAELLRSVATTLKADATG